MRGSCLLRNFIIAALMVVVPSFEPTNGRPSPPRLTFTATPVSGSFREGDKVVLRFEIKNEGQSDVRVSPAFVLNYDIYLDVRTGAGDPISWCGINARRVFFGDKFGVHLALGKTLGMERQVSCDDWRQAGCSISWTGRVLQGVVVRHFHLRL